MSFKTHKTDEAIIKGLLEQESDAMMAFIDVYSGLLYHIVAKTLFPLGSKEDIEECLNDIFLAIWDHIDSFRQESQLSQWVGSIAKYKALDLQRRLIHQHQLEQTEDISVLSQKVSEDKPLDYRLLEAENLKAFYDLISPLSLTDQSIFIERYVAEKSTGEIAENLNMKRSAVNNHLSKGRQKLKKLNPLTHKEVKRQ